MNLEILMRKKVGLKVTFFETKLDDNIDNNGISSNCPM